MSERDRCNSRNLTGSRKRAKRKRCDQVIKNKIKKGIEEKRKKAVRRWSAVYFPLFHLHINMRCLQPARIYQLELARLDSVQRDEAGVTSSEWDATL